MIEVFSSGGGTQSTCIAALIVQGRLPKPDYVVIADTEYECSETWAYLDKHVRPALASVGVGVHRISGSEWKSKPAHGKDFLSHNENTILLPTWTNQTGDTGKLNGFCSKRWKVQVVDRYLSRRFGITRRHYRKWIGFSLDESKRAMSIMAGKEGQKGLIRLPLIQDIPLRRHEAIREVEKMGWPTPPRSRCWLCPNQGDDEWRDLKDKHPDEFLAAKMYEQELQKHDPFVWLHKACIPLGQVDLREEVTDPGLFCSSGVCFV